MRAHSWVNLALLGLVVGVAASGLAGMSSGTAGQRWLLWLHDLGGDAIVALLPWKAAIVLDSWRRASRRGAVFEVPRLAFAFSMLLLLATLLSGLAWTVVGRRIFFGYSLMTIHVGLGMSLLPLFLWHVVRMRYVFRLRAAVGRRALLRSGVALLAGLAFWQGSGVAIAAAPLAGSARRFTGSYPVAGSFPTVSWLFDDPPPVDPASWRLVVGGAVGQPLMLSYDELRSVSRDDLFGTIDCTGGWYASQAWRGIRLGRLLDWAAVKPGARTVTLVAVSGYARRFDLAAARGFLLATEVAGAPLVHGHGFPLRLVAPEHRGYDWVKWVTRVTVDDRPYWLQPPLPLR